MTTQFTELETINEDDLKTVQGGSFWGKVFDISLNFVPVVGIANTISDLAGNGTIGERLAPD